jgi:hypothetical protein
MIPFPIYIAPAFTLEKRGHAIAHDEVELIQLLDKAMALSPIQNCVLEHAIFCSHCDHGVVGGKACEICGGMGYSVPRTEEDS